MKLVPMAAIVVGAVLTLATVRAQQTSSHEPHQHSQATTQKSWMMDYEDMMAEMKAADARVQSLADRMVSARGSEKVPAIQDVVSELVKDQLSMHQHMMVMHDHMMSQMPMK
jgi:competence protein ComGF